LFDQFNICHFITIKRLRKYFTVKGIDIDRIYKLKIRFLIAQEDIYLDALAEIMQGRKHSHWMWFIFPQFKGLGSSEKALFYAIHSLQEARAFLEHPVLGKRLREITETLLKHGNKKASEIFSYPDDLKLHSSLTLFEAASEGENVFTKALETFFKGKRDQKTLELLKN
jgi:uncharacterized protein (DUF1810 family)